ncbi:MAG: xylulose kinase, partial [Deltaproteobacteria bacterium]|nr:xylulose kinase [Deltaproteobacteria bacterium]
DPLRICGGGAQSDVWCQIFSDVLGRTIKRVENPRQANARGAAFIASVGMGDIEFEDIPGLVKTEKTFHPNNDNQEIYEKLYKEFRYIYKQSKNMYQRLNS